MTLSSGIYTVRAEVRRESRDAPWPLYPGMKAEMFVPVKAVKPSRGNFVEVGQANSVLGGPSAVVG